MRAKSNYTIILQLNEGEEIHSLQYFSPYFLLNFSKWFCLAHAKGNR